MRFVIVVVAEAVPKGRTVCQGQQHSELACIPVFLTERQGDKPLVDGGRSSAAANDVVKKDEPRLPFNTFPWFRFSKAKNAICCGDESSCVKILMKTRSAASGRGDTYVKAPQIQDPILKR